MAETNILSISLKQYKQEIDSLKGSLLGLEKGSKEYESVLNEVRDRQSKLNEVLADSKSKGDIAANSMAEMKAQLKEMKEEANNLDVGSERFKELSAEILETTNKLKELEEAQGTFSRNVGNYAGGVISAFDKMGISIGGLKGAFNTATQAGGAFNTILTTLKAHPIMAALTILIGVILKVKDAISNSETASRKWERAMASFQPIIDIFNRLMEQAAIILADVVDWIGKNLPAAMNFAAKVITNFVKIQGGMAKVVVNVAGAIVRGYTMAFDFVAKGVQNLANNVASVLQYIPGVGDEVANAVRKGGNSIANFAGNVDSTVKGFINSATSGIDNLVNKITTAVNSVAGKFETAVAQRRNTVTAQHALEDNLRSQESMAAESELKQAQLRDKIATASGKEKIALLKELRQEIETNGKREVEIAKEKLRIEKTLASFAPNSKAENERIAQLEANVVKAEANYQQSFARIDRMQSATEASMTRTAQRGSANRVANTEKEETDKLKAEVAAEKERQRLAKEAIDKNKASLETSALVYEGAIKREMLAYKQLNEEHSKDTDLMTEHLEKAKTLRIQQIDEEIAAYNKLLENTNLSATQQITITNTITKLTEQKIDETRKYDKELRNIALSRLEILAEERQAVIDTDTRIQYLGKEYANLYATFSKKEVKAAVDALGVDEETKQQILDDYTVLHNDIKKGTNEFAKQLENERHINNLATIENRRIHLEELKQQNLISGEDAINMEQEINLALENEDLRHAQVQDKIRNDNERKSKAHVSKVISMYRNMADNIGNVMNAVASSMEDDIKRKEENGEITEEQAKKQFESVKILQIAAATVNTISGAIGAFMGTWKDETIQPTWLRGAIAGANAASVTAMGVMNISKIKQQQWNSSGSAAASTGTGTGTRDVGNIDFSGVKVNPLLDENADLNRMTTLSETQKTDQRVYILQSDIADSQNQVSIRQSNTTF